MYTTDCKDPNCSDCSEISSAQSSEEGSESEIPKTGAQNSALLLRTVEEIHQHLLSAFDEKMKWEQLSRKLKDQVHSEILELMTILRYREQELCMKIDRRYNDEVLKIDELTLFQAIDKIEKREKHPAPPETIPIFTSDFEDLKRRLVYFGQLSNFDASQLRVKKPSEYFEGKNIGQIKILNAEELAADCSHLSIQEDEITIVDEIDPKGSKEKAVEPEKCEGEKIETKENDKRKTCRRGKNPLQMRNMKLRLAQGKDGKLGKEVDRLIVTRKDLLKEGEVQIGGISGVKEKRSLNEKTIDSKSSGKRSKKSASQIAKEKEENFQKLKRQLCQVQIDLMRKKMGDSSVLDEEYNLVKPCKPMAQFHWHPVSSREPEKLPSQEKKTSVEDLFNEYLMEDSFVRRQSVRREPEKLSFQVKRRIDALNMKKPEETHAKGDEGLCKPEVMEKDGQLGSEQEKEKNDELRYRQIRMQNKQLEEINRKLRIFQDSNLACLEKEKKEIEVLLKGSDLLDETEKMTNEKYGFEESSEEDSSSDLDMEIISRNEAATIPADVSLSPPLPPKNRFKLLLKRNSKPPSSSESSGIGKSESTEVKGNSSAEQPGKEPKNPFKFLLKRSPKPPSPSSESSGIGESQSTEMKESSSSTEQPGQQSPKDAADQDCNPTVALRSSFTKYLEKEPESEWLATGATWKPCSLCSDKVLPAANSRKEMLNPEIYQWLH